MSPPALTTFGRRSCRHCGRVLTVHQEARGSTCDDPDCRRRALVERLRADAKVREETRRRVEWERMRILAGYGVPKPAHVLPVTVPSNDHPASALPAERREEFAAWLGEAARDAAEGRLPTPEEPWDLMLAGPADEQVVASACGTCRGKCCQTGYARRAYVDAALLRRWLDRHPGATAGDAAEAYAAHIPERTYEESCIYHTETGCALPREMRADICNAWLCEGLSRWLHRRPPEAPRRAFVASLRDGRVVRHSIVDQEADPASE